MERNNLIAVRGIITENKELIPVWDERVQYDDSEIWEERFKNYTTYKYRLKNSSQKSDSLSWMVLDIETKKLSLGIEIDICPKLEDLEFKEGDNIYYIEDNLTKEVDETKIVSINFKVNTTDVYLGKDLEKYIFYRHIKNMKIEDALPYIVKFWKPVYNLANGVVIHSTAFFYHRPK